MGKSYAIRNFSAVCLLLCIGFAIQANSVRAHEVKNMSGTLDGIINSSLAVPAGNAVQQVTFAKGVQIYTYNGSAWPLTNVSADLFDFKGNKFAYHFFLPEKDSNGGLASWETSHPFSRVTGKAIQAVAVDTDAIPWLLLNATSNAGSLRRLGKTTIIQRLFTSRGLPPSSDTPAAVGTIFESNYTALYVFSSKEV